MPVDQITYSEKYFDEKFEYRHVILPHDIARLVPKTHLMTETEWRNLGVQQSPGWIHYMVHTPEPHILLFRRPLPSKQGWKSIMLLYVWMWKLIPFKRCLKHLTNWYTASFGRSKVFSSVCCCTIRWMWFNSGLLTWTQCSISGCLWIIIIILCHHYWFVSLMSQSFLLRIYTEGISIFIQCVNALQ